VSDLHTIVSLIKESNYIKLKKKSTTYVNQAKELTALKKELPWFKEVDSVSLQSSLRNLDTAFKNFFQSCQFFGLIDISS
jgi:transposase